MKVTIVAALTLLLATTTHADLKPVTKIVSQSDAPVTIASYTATYNERSSVYSTAGIYHNLRYVSKSSKEIVAIQFGLVSFDAWNEYLDRTAGFSSDALVPGKEQRGTWITNRYGGHTFLTGVAYVSRVRFADGAIWSANTDDVLEELRKIEKDFDVERLKKEQEPPKP